MSGAPTTDGQAFATEPALAAPPDIVLAELRGSIVRVFPELAESRFSLLTAGWDSVAVDVDDRLIFKFPRHDRAAEALEKEARLLAAIRPAVAMPVPDITLHDGQPLFSRHAKLKGEHLVAAQYERLPETARQRLAEDMARFYAELHALPAATMETAGAGPVEAWLPPEDILARVVPALPPDLRAWAERTVAAWRALPPDPLGRTYGFFDGHGWNMAFDHAEGRLNGIYDFADSGFGPRHQEFIYSNFIAPDLTARIVAAYEARTGLALDPKRIALLTGAHRLFELASLADDPRHAGMARQMVADWAAQDIS